MEDSLKNTLYVIDVEWYNIFRQRTNKPFIRARVVADHAGTFRLGYGIISSEITKCTDKGFETASTIYIVLDDSLRRIGKWPYMI